MGAILALLKRPDSKTTETFEQTYFDRLAYLFERVAWVTILWAFIVNVTSSLDQEKINYTFLLIFVASVFNFVYYRYGYLLIKKHEYRFYVSAVVFPFLIWIFVHLHQEYVPFFLLPYYILILATSLTLKRIDVVLALVSSLSFIILESVLLKLPLDAVERQLSINQVTALLVFAWVALKLADQVRIERGESGSARQEAVEVEKKSTLFKEFASELVLDRQKAQVLLEEAPYPILITDAKRKIMEVNRIFQILSDFKNNNLLGKDLSFVLKTAQPLNFEQKSFLPQVFEGIILTRRNKEKKIQGKAHFLLGRDQRLKQILILVEEIAN